MNIKRTVNFKLEQRKKKGVSVTENVPIQKKHFEDTTFMTFRAKLKSTEKEVIFLTADELKQLMTYDIPKKKEHLDRVRDAFLFCCYSGLRHSDLFNLRRSDVHEDHIKITTVKTAHSLRIELNDMTHAILKKYEHVPYPDNKALPVLSNQKMNDYIKDLCEMVGIDTPVRVTYYKVMSVSMRSIRSISLSELIQDAELSFARPCRSTSLPMLL